MNPKNILVIEDSPTQAQYVAIILKSAGYTVLLANTGQQGLALAQSQAVDLVLLDVVLPDLDGYSVCLQLREQSATYIPVLMFTDLRTSVEDKVVGLAAGADDYMSKGFDQRELLARVTALLRVKQLFDELLARLTNEHHAYQALKRIALTDQLTSLYNRHYFVEVLDREFGLAQRHTTALACLMTDIDHFRNFNNRYGHALGDWVLRQTASLMKDKMRQSDVIGRYGGEEFVILLPMTELEAARDLAERLRTLIADQAWESPAGILRITISAGVAALPSTSITRPDQLVTCADEALYRAKAGGRNRVEVHDR
jgi:two-component system, cell cycle response regulator